MCGRGNVNDGSQNDPRNVTANFPKVPEVHVKCIICLGVVTQPSSPPYSIISSFGTAATLVGGGREGEVSVTFSRHT